MKGLEPGKNIGDSVDSQMAHVQRARRVGEHGQYVSWFSLAACFGLRLVKLHAMPFSTPLPVQGGKVELLQR